MRDARIFLVSLASGLLSSLRSHYCRHFIGDCFSSKYECNIFEPQLRVRNSWLPIQLYYHKFRGSYWKLTSAQPPATHRAITCFLTVESAKLLATYSASATTSSKGFFWQLKRPNSFSSYPSSCAKWSSETPSDWVPNSWLPFQLPRFRGSFLSLLSHVSDSTMPAYHSSFTSGCQLVANMSLLPIKTQVFLIMI